MTPTDPMAPEGQTRPTMSMFATKADCDKATIEYLERELNAANERAEKAEDELETERMRLAACGVVALADTPKSAAMARDILPKYRSASLDDVIRRVDECMNLRSQLEALQRENEALRADAELFRALEWADDEIVDGDKNNIASHFQYCPAGWNGNPSNRYYMGANPKTFRQCAEYALEQFDAALASNKGERDERG